jgi:hypothetical protein
MPPAQAGNPAKVSDFAGKEKEFSQYASFAEVV